MAVAVSLDDRADLGRRDQGAQGTDVGAHRLEVDLRPDRPMIVHRHRLRRSRDEAHDIRPRDDAHDLVVGVDDGDAVDLLVVHDRRDVLDASRRSRPLTVPLSSRRRRFAPAIFFSSFSRCFISPGNGTPSPEKVDERRHVHAGFGRDEVVVAQDAEQTAVGVDDRERADVLVGQNVSGVFHLRRRRASSSTEVDITSRTVWCPPFSPPRKSSPERSASSVRCSAPTRSVATRSGPVPATVAARPCRYAAGRRRVERRRAVREQPADRCP